MKTKDLFTIHTNQLITLLTCYNSHMVQAKNKEEEETTLEEINKAIDSYRAKITKIQVKN